MQYRAEVREFKVDRMRKKYVLEIMCDNKNWGEAFNMPSKAHFSFGIQKAKMILGAMAVIEKFVESNGLEPSTDIRIKIKNEKFDEPCYCLKESSFDYYGRTIDKPYLTLESIKEPVITINFGLEKAKALMHLEDKMEEFIREYSEKNKPKKEEITL